jgi:bile acid:Na+ symporter, BASS family
MRASLRDALPLLRDPERLLSALMSMYVAMPLFAVIVALTTDLPPVVKIALVTYAISPIPPLLSLKARKAGGCESYALGLVVAGSLLSIVLIPLAMELFQVIFGMPLRMASWSVASLVLTSVIAPLALGMVIRAAAPAVADLAAAPVAALSNVLLLASFVPVLIFMADQLFSVIGGGALGALAAFGAVGLIIGHTLGGPRLEDRTVLALYTSARHPGVAVAIAQTNFPEQRLALAAILLAMLVSAVLALPYMNWIRHQKPGQPAATA